MRREMMMNFKHGEPWLIYTLDRWDILDDWKAVREHDDNHSEHDRRDFLIWQSRPHVRARNDGGVVADTPQLTSHSSHKFCPAYSNFLINSEVYKALRLKSMS